MKQTITSRVFGNVEFEFDDEDAPIVTSYRWHLLKRRKVFYVRGTVDGKMILLHRHLTKAPAGMTVDHIDGNPLNNRRVNLRVCTREENVAYAFERGAHVEKYEGAKRINRVKKTLADGSVRYYEYHRSRAAAL